MCVNVCLLCVVDVMLLMCDVCEDVDVVMFLMLMFDDDVLLC